MSGKLADRWAGIGVPALVFWVAISLALEMAGGGSTRPSTWMSWLEAQSGVTQVAVLLWALLVVGASAVVVSRMTPPTLRLLEGYWPNWARRRRTAVVKQLRLKHDADVSNWQLLQDALDTGGSLTSEQQDAWSRLDLILHRRPADPDALMPTRTGNILKSAETRPKDKYGLDSIVVWPRLWLVIPDSARQELASARGSLDGAVAAVVWGILFSVIVPLALFLSGLSDGWSRAQLVVGLIATIGGVLVAGAAIVWWAPARAEVFGDLMESAFDLHRNGLYEQLRWPLPRCPARELESGRQLTAYLWRGSDEPFPRFTVK